MAGLPAWDVQTWVAVISGLVALISLGLNFLTVQRQMSMQGESLKMQMDSEVLAWGERGVDVLTRAAHLAEIRGGGMSPTEFQKERIACMSEMSALVDKGRLHFPNKGAGQDVQKSRAFRGGRPFILNPLVFAYHELEALSHLDSSPDREAARFFIMCRREFVSELQQHLNPRRRAEQLSRFGLTSQRKKSHSYEDNLRLAEELERLHPGILERKQDAGWARNVARAQRGDRSPPPKKTHEADAPLPKET